MQYGAAALQKLVEQFEKMPGIGRKTAQRMAFYVLDLPKEEGLEFSDTIRQACEKIHRCSVCCNLTENEKCSICSDESRDHSTICVVEDSQSLLAVEKTGEYKGVYHVLHGAISPIDGIGPEDLTVKELLARVNEGGIKEIILATDSDVEGEATAMYLTKLIKPLGLKITRLASGLSVGTDVQYADGVTLSKAIEGRFEV
jgi:recombination protein RecR